MHVPVQVTFRGVDHTPALDDHVQKHVDKLSRFHDRIVSCRVAVERPHKHAKSGSPYRVRVDVGVPGEEIVVSRTHGDDLASQDAYAAIDVAFDEVGRKLQDHVTRAQQKVKTHEHHRHGTVRKLFTYEGYGFLEGAPGEEIYFQRSSVLDGGFDRLTIGSRVSFVEEPGEKGPQATSVRVLH